MQCGMWSALRKSHTSRSVQCMIGEMSSVSFPLMQPRVRSPWALTMEIWLLEALRLLRYWSSCCSVPLNFRLDISTSLRCALCADSWCRMPMSVTFPAPAFSLYSLQHHRTLRVGRICRSIAVWYMLRCGFMSCTSGYCVLTKRMTSGGSTDVRFMWDWNLTPASCAMWYMHCESFPPENAR